MISRWRSPFIIVPLALALSVEACTSTYELSTVPHENHPRRHREYRTYSDFLAQAEGKKVRIVLTDGQERLGWIARADADSIGWIDASDSTALTVATSRVQTLNISHNYAWHVAIGVFLLLAVPVVALWDLPTGSISGGVDNSGRDYFILMDLSVTPLGAMIGTAIIHTDEYRVGPDTALTSPPARK